MTDSFISKMQVYRGERLHGFVDQQMLTNALMLEPQKLPQIISYIYGTKYAGYSTAIDLLTGGLGHKITLERPSYEWNLEIEDERPVRILGAKVGPDVCASGTNYGRGLVIIDLTLKEAAYGPGAILELDDTKYQLRVMAEPIANGDGFSYPCVIANGDMDATVPGEYLLQDKFVTRAGSSYEEGSDEADIISYNTGAKFRNYTSTVRLKIDITGSAKADVLAYALKDPVSGKSTYLWADYQLWQATRRFMERIEYQLLTGQTTATADGTFQLKGKNGRPIVAGAGIDQQIAPGNVRYYTELTADGLENFLMDLSYNILDIGNRKFVLLTGEMGMRELDRAIKQKMVGMTLIDTHFVSGSGQNLSLGGQFTSYKMSNGLELSCKLLPFLDDPNHNRVLHPVTKKPISSYTMYVLDNSFRNGKANIQKIVKKNRELLQWVVPGSCSPSGFSNSVNSIGANAVDGYSVQFLAEIGVAILDPRGCGKMIYNI